VPLRRWLRRIAIWALVLSCTWIAVELLLLLLLDPILPSGPFLCDRALGFRGRPHFGDSNRFGFNDVERSLTPPPSGWRRAPRAQPDGERAIIVGFSAAVLREHLLAQAGIDLQLVGEVE
jgi:hypothetical protein